MKVKDVPANYLFQFQRPFPFEERWVWAKMSCRPDNKGPIIASNNYHLVLLNMDERTSFNLSEPTDVVEISLVDMTDRLQHRGSWLGPDYPVRNIIRDYSELPNQ